MKKVIYIFFIATALFSLFGFIIAGTKNLNDKYLRGEYEVSLRLIKGESPYFKESPYPYPYSYNIGNYIINIIGLSFYNHPVTLKLLRILSGWSLGILIFLFYFPKPYPQGFIRAGIFFLTYHFILAFGFFAINEPYALFFIMLGLLFFHKKKNIAGILAYCLAVSIKQFAILLLPFLAVYLWNQKDKKKLYTVLFTGSLITVILPLLIPGYLDVLSNTTNLGFANRYDNLYVLGGSILPFLLGFKLNDMLFLANKALFVFIYLFLLLKFFLKKDRNIFSAYFIPVIIWLILPPNAFLWGNYFFWVSIPILLAPSLNAVFVYSLLLIPEYLLKMANSGHKILQIPLYLATEISAVIIFIYIFRFIWNFKENQSNQVPVKSVIFFILLQAVLMFIVGVMRNNLLWFI